jgi:hypothetical protein
MWGSTLLQFVRLCGLRRDDYNRASMRLPRWFRTHRGDLLAEVKKVGLPREAKETLISCSPADCQVYEHVSL